MSFILRRTALLAVLAASACAPAARPATTPAPAAAAAKTAAPGLHEPAPYRAAIAAGTRSESGAPGPRYWQQAVSYHIRAELEPASATLKGSERVVYRNHSPDALPSLVLNLHQNVFSEGVPRNRTVPITGGITLTRVAINGQALAAKMPAEIPVASTPRASAPAGYSVQGTLARLQLPAALQPGDSLVLEAEWSFKVPPKGAFRTGWEDALGGRAFVVGQWYPQIAVYDDLRGWDATPYLGDGEFYLEYGDFDVALTLPAGWLVGATGELQNPNDVLTPEARQRLAQALAGDAVRPVVSETDLAAGRATQGARGGKLTWHYRAERVRDFGFAASDRYVWDATRARVPGENGGEKNVAVHALYRPGAPGWGEAARYGQHVIGFLSRDIMPYLYPQVTIAEGPIGGMEYPQMVFIARPSSAEALYDVIAHEVGHQWFPMMVGSDEASYAWMDEGVTTYFEARARGDFTREADPYAGDRKAYLAVAGNEREVPLMRHTDLVSPYGARTVAAYTKPGTLMRSLRAVLGDATFERAMRTYAREWLFKHPAPWDFFRTMERVSGRDLAWFFEPWWFGTGTLDQAIERVEPAGANAVRVTLADRGEIRMPIFLSAVSAAGDTVRVELPVERWGEGRTLQTTISARAPIVRVEIDPDAVLPDVERANNVWSSAEPTH